MITEAQKRSLLLRRIQQIPSDKLNELNEFISKLEQVSNSREKTLSFAGAWENIDVNIFSALTDHLISNRQRSSRRDE